MSISLARGINRRNHRETHQRIDQTLMLVPAGASNRVRRKVMEKALHAAYGRNLFHIQHRSDRLYAVILAPMKGRKGWWAIEISVVHPDGTEEIYPLLLFSDHAVARMRQAGVDLRRYAGAIATGMIEQNANQIPEKFVTPDGYLAISDDNGIQIATTFVPWSAMSPAKARALQAQFGEERS